MSTNYHQKKLRKIVPQQNVYILLQKVQQLYILFLRNNPLEYKNTLYYLTKSVPRPIQIELVNENSLNNTKSNNTKYLFNKILYIQQNLQLPHHHLILVCEKLIIPKQIKEITIHLFKIFQSVPVNYRLLIIPLQYFTKKTYLNFNGQFEGKKEQFFRQNKKNQTFKNSEESPKRSGLYEIDVLFQFLNEQQFRLNKNKSYKDDIRLFKSIIQKINLFDFQYIDHKMNYKQSIYGICEKIGRIMLHQNVSLAEYLYIHPLLKKLSQIQCVQEKNDIQHFFNQVIRLKYPARNVIILDIFQYTKFQVQIELKIKKELESIQRIQNQRKRNLDVLTKQTIQINDALTQNTRQYTKSIQEYKNNSEFILKNLQNQMQQKLDLALQQNENNLQAIKNKLMVNSFLGVLNIGFTVLSIIGGPVKMILGAVGAGFTRSLVQQYSSQSKFSVDFEKLDMATSVFKICQTNQQKAQYTKNRNQIKQKIRNLQNKQHLTQDQIKQLKQAKKNEIQLLKQKQLNKTAQRIQAVQQILKSGEALVNNITEGLSQIQKNEIEKAKLQQYKNTVNNKFSQFLSSIEDIIITLLGFKNQFNSINENEVHERYVVALGFIKKIFQGLKQISINLSDQIKEFNTLYKAIIGQENRDLVLQKNLFLDKINIDIAYIQKLEIRLSTIQDVKMLVSFMNFDIRNFNIIQFQKVINNYLLVKMYKNLKVNIIRRNIPMSLEKFQFSNQSFQMLQKAIYDFYSPKIDQTTQFPLLNGWIPLYNWKYQSYQNQFRNLFNGKSVTLSTSPVYKDQISAIRLLKMPRMIVYVKKYKQVKIQGIKVFLKLNLKKNLYNVQNQLFTFNLEEKLDEQNYLQYSNQQINLIIAPIQTYETMLENQNKLNLKFADSLKSYFNFKSGSIDQVTKLNSRQYSPYSDWEVNLTFQKKELSANEWEILKTSVLQLYGHCQYIQNSSFQANPYIYDDCYNKYKNNSQNQNNLVGQLKIIKKQQYQFLDKQLVSVLIRSSLNGKLLTITPVQQDISFHGNYLKAKRFNLCDPYRPEIKFQTFRLISCCDFKYKIFTSQINKCLDVYFCLQYDNTPIIQYVTHGGYNQDWMFQPTGYPSQFFIKGAESGKYIQLDQNGMICINPLRKSIDQKWKIEILSQSNHS